MVALRTLTDQDRVLFTRGGWKSFRPPSFFPPIPTAQLWVSCGNFPQLSGGRIVLEIKKTDRGVGGARRYVDDELARAHAEIRSG